MTARLAVLALAAWCAWAGEYALLDNGTSLRVDRHEAAGDRWRLCMNGAYIEVPAARVVGFEAEVPDPNAAPKLPAAPAAPAPDPRRVVDEAANKYGLPPEFLHSVVAAESGYNQHALSPKGAIGLMQIMPATAKERNADPYNVEQNVDAGAQYLADLLRKYGKYDFSTELALAAYNAGPGAVDRYQGIPPYRETQSYIERVTRDWLAKTKKP